MLKWVCGGACGVALLVTLVSCGVGDDEARPSGRVGVAYRLPVRCEESVLGVSALGPGWEVIGGVVALRTTDSAGDSLQLSERNYRGDPTLRLSGKRGLFVRRGSEAEIRVPETFHDRVAIGWGYYAIPTHRISVGPCDSHLEWLGFSGSIYVADPECVTLEVILENTTVETVRMGMGTSCPS